MQHHDADLPSRRGYWTAQMDAAFDFMKTVSTYPVRECREPLASLRDAARVGGVEVAFSTTKIGRARDRLFYLRSGLIDDFLAVARDMNARGWTLKIEDAFRTRTIQTELAKMTNVFDVILKRVLWEREGDVPSPDLMFRRLSALIATRPEIGTHMCGSALDISVLNRDDGSEIDRGGPYIELSERTPMASPFISPQASQSRKDISGLMARHGFLAYPYEFWHYSKGDAYEAHLSHSDTPPRYGPVDMDPATLATTPIDRPDLPLHDFEDIQNEIREALGRRREPGPSSNTH